VDSGVPLKPGWEWMKLLRADRLIGGSWSSSTGTNLEVEDYSY
jgi:hypothetical protein